MNLQNIISAGRMIAMVVTLMGTLSPGLMQLTLVWNVVFGVAFLGLAIAIQILLSWAERFGTTILVLGSLTLLVGILAVVLTPLSPFAWMTALVALTLFIDTLCLKIALN